uniref:BACK domain-containing protein n=1 Tax=Panagrolaimus sp. ES5 TaxID=591445 RepID=A0AC34GD37_9BILA
MILVDLSEYYQIKPLKDVCDAFITENAAKPENVLKLYESFKRYTLKTAMAKVMETIASNTDEILKSKDFSSIEKETLLDIVKMDNLNSKEEELFQAVLIWVLNKHKNNENEIKTELADVFPFIRFPIMDLEFLHNFVEKYNQ